MTEVSINNKNNYPISVRIKTNNVDTTYPQLQALTTVKNIFDWTALDKADGHWVFYITNNVNDMSDSFAHGYFSNGELNSFAELISEGNQLKVRISE